MNIVYTFDEGYARIASVSILSLLESNIEASELNIIIVDCGLSEKSISQLTSLTNSFNRSIKFVNGKNMENKIPIELELSYWSFVCYVRLFFPELLSQYDRVLHIDCDTLIKGSLEDVYKVNLNSNIICAACYDCLPTAKYQSGMSKEDAYFSSGIILFDLNAMREEDIQQKFIDYIVDQKGKLPHLDQDVLNVVLKDRIALLPANYNLMTQNVVFKESSCDFFVEEPYYTKSEIKQALEDPIMIHLVGYKYVSKPWSQPCYNPFNKDWISYYKKLSFDDGELLKYKPKKFGILREIVCWFWNIGLHIPLIKDIEFHFEKKRIRNKCDILSGELK